MKDKIRMHPDDLLPTLPDPRELRPFPTQRSIEFVGHEAGICSVSVDPTGQWMLSADRMGAVKLWDVQTGHCRRTWNCQSASDEGNNDICLAWNPNKALFMFALGFGSMLKLIVPPEMAGTEATLLALESMRVKSDVASVDSIKWNTLNIDEEGTVMTIEHPAKLSDVQWHRRGDYFAGLCPEANTGAHVLTVHQLSSRTSQHPFRKMPGLMRAVRFHPTRPHLVLVTQKTVRIYDLAKKEHLKKLMPGVQSLTSVAVHSGGDNLIVGSHDAKLCWFDLDYSVRPYRVLTSHKASIRSVAFHPSYPLFATGGDDGVVQVVHGQVYDDLATNPMIVPVKTIKDFGVAVTRVQFHPVQPWLFAATSDGTIALYV
jgi:ribosome biogenesis protein ERB1